MDQFATMQERLGVRKFREMMRLFHQNPLRKKIIHLLMESSQPLTTMEMMRTLQSQLGKNELVGITIDTKAIKRQLNFFIRRNIVVRQNTPSRVSANRYKLDLEAVDLMNISLQELLNVIWITKNISMDCWPSDSSFFLFDETKKYYWIQYEYKCWLERFSAQAMIWSFGTAW